MPVHKSAAANPCLQIRNAMTYTDNGQPMPSRWYVRLPRHRKLLAYLLWVPIILSLGRLEKVRCQFGLLYHPPKIAIAPSPRTARDSARIRVAFVEPLLTMNTAI